VRLRIQPLDDEHDRAAFACGHAGIDDFLKKIARQRQQRRIGATLVAVDADGDPRRIVGYYTMLPHQFRGHELPDPYRKGSRIGNVYAVPGALLAQLGVSLDFQGNGIGKKLMSHALTRVVSFADEWGCAAVVTDPVDDRAKNFYTGFDFEALGDGTPRMIVGIKTIIAALEHIADETTA
jgi:GNAT superfamily N-acetyltransferase